MRKVKTKLNSRKGASVIIALVYLLVAVVVGVIVMTAANSGMTRLDRQIENRQAYYSVYSAAKLISEDVQNAAFEASYSITETETFHEATFNTDGSVKTKAWMETSESKTPASGNLNFPTDWQSIFGSTENDVKGFYFETVPSDLQPASYDGSHASLDEKSYELVFPASENTDAVNGVLTLDKDFNVKVVLQTGSDADSNVANVLTMTFEANVSEDTEVESTTSGNTSSRTATTTTTISWGDPVIRKGEN